MSRELHDFKEKLKEKWKSKKTTIVKKDEEKKPTCSHCEKKGHDEKHCWKLHPELKSKWAQPRKGKKKTMTMVQNLGSNSEDETNVTTMGIKGKNFIASFSSHIYSTKYNAITNFI